MSNASVYKNGSGTNSSFKIIIKGALLAFVISLVLVLLFALIVKLTNIGTGAIAVVNQIIKIVSVFMGVLFAVKERSKWFINGMFGGLLYSIISFLVFSLIISTFNWSGFGIDLGVSAVVGIIAALIAAGKR